MELRLSKTVGIRLVTGNNKCSYGNRGRFSMSGIAATDSLDPWFDMFSFHQTLESPSSFLTAFPGT